MDKRGAIIHAIFWDLHTVVSKWLAPGSPCPVLSVCVGLPTPFLFIQSVLSQRLSDCTLLQQCLPLRGSSPAPRWNSLSSLRLGQAEERGWLLPSACSSCRNCIALCVHGRASEREGRLYADSSRRGLTRLWFVVTMRVNSNTHSALLFSLKG